MDQREWDDGAKFYLRSYMIHTLICHFTDKLDFETYHYTPPTHEFNHQRPSTIGTQNCMQLDKNRSSS